MMRPMCAERIYSNANTLLVCAVASEKKRKSEQTAIMNTEFCAAWEALYMAVMQDMSYHSTE
jgi:hypothetical protein